MQIGVIGLGRMGGNIVRRLMRGGHECVVFDANAAVVQALAGEGAIRPARSPNWWPNCNRRAQPGSCCPRAR